MPRLFHASRPLLTLVTLAVVATGCGSHDATEPPAAADQPRQHAPSRAHTQAPASASPSSAAASPATPSSPAPTHRAHPARRPVSATPSTRRTAPEEHLLTAEQLPALAHEQGEKAGWTVEATGPEDSVAVGACQQASLEAIGAVSAVRRTFVAAGDAPGQRATQVVARFADRRSAWRARQVLWAWHGDCEAEVGPLRAVELARGSGENYRVRPGDTHRARTAGLGIVARGAYLSLVEITAPSGDYPTDRAPVRAAVRRIARSFS